jgi:hypothetical protein
MSLANAIDSITEHNPRDIASGFIATPVAALRHERSRFGGLEYSANQGEARPLPGAARV